MRTQGSNSEHPQNDTTTIASTLHSQSLDLSAKLVFAWLCLSFLWAASGVQVEILWGRSLGFLGLVCLAVFAWFFSHRENPGLKAVVPFKTPSGASLKTGFAYSLLLSASALLILGFFSSLGTGTHWNSGSIGLIFEGLTVIGILAFSAASYFYEFFARTFLADDWGSTNVILLEALVVGVGLQHFGFFLCFYVGGLISQHIVRRHGIYAGASARFFATLLVGLIMRMLTV